MGRRHTLYECSLLSRRRYTENSRLLFCFTFDVGREQKLNEDSTFCLMSSTETVHVRKKMHLFQPNWLYISDKSRVKVLAWVANLLHAFEHQRGSVATLCMWSSAGFLQLRFHLVASVDSEQTCKNGRS